MLCYATSYLLFVLFIFTLAWGLFEAEVTLATNMARTTFILDGYYSSHDALLFITHSFFFFLPFFPFMY
jgi:hypothetical protein